MIAIRKARAADISSLVALARHTFEISFAKDNTPENMANYLNETFTAEKIESELEESQSQYFVAASDEKLVGYARVRFSEEVKDKLIGPSLELQRIYVAPESQGLNIGSQLMESCIEYAISNGYHWIWLGVWEKNFSAQKFYQRWGFEKFGAHIFQMGDDPQTDWLMSKKLV